MWSHGIADKLGYVWVWNGQSGCLVAILNLLLCSSLRTEKMVGDVIVAIRSFNLVTWRDYCFLLFFSVLLFYAVNHQL